jgi:hypothetical protein
MNEHISNLAAISTLGLAQVADPAGSSVLLWIAGAAGAAVIFNQLFSAWARLTGRFKEKEHPDPRDKFLTDALTALEDRHSQRTENLRLEMKKDISGLHEKINRTTEAVGELRGELKRIGVIHQ